MPRPPKKPARAKKVAVKKSKQELAAKRVNNPPAGMVTPSTDPDLAAAQKTYAYDPHLDPQLQWAGKAEHLSFTVPTQTLHVQERIDPRTIIEAVRKQKDETKWAAVTLLKAQMNTDLLTDDLKKKRASNESFWLIGQPDVELIALKGADKGKYEVEVQGFDYYNTLTGSIESGSVKNIAMWLLDPDYDGRSLFPRQVFFPLSGEKDGWSRLAKNLKAEIDEDLIEQYRGTVSLPFTPGPNKKVAVKIVDDRGIESLKIIKVE